MDRIAELFVKTGDKVDWTHIGAGDAFDIEAFVIPRIKGKDKKLNLFGEVSREVVLRYMKEEAISVFVNLSDSEGIPVTIMEAISFGIPVVATDVGGVSEIVNDRTGVLVDSNTTAEALVTIFEKKAPTMFKEEFRKGVREFWEENFSAEVNYPKFCDDIKDSMVK